MQAPTISTLNTVAQTGNLSNFRTTGLSTLMSDTGSISYLEDADSVLLNLSSVTTVDTTLYTEQGTLVSPQMTSPVESASSLTDGAESDETASAESKLVQDALEWYREFTSRRVEYLLTALARQWQETSGDTSTEDTGDAQNGLAAIGGIVSLDGSAASGAISTGSDYFSAENTAARIVDFALSFYTGGDRAAYAAKIAAAVMKGFEQAQAAFGGTLPGVCQNTITLALNAINEWAAGGVNISA